MIVAMSGGVGGGKTISAVKYAMLSSQKNKTLTNFKLKTKNYYRLKKQDVINTNTTIPEGCKKEKITKNVNWDFWMKNKNSDVYLDEIHNLVNSRNAMSKDNKLYNEWISQIRKIWGSSGDQSYLNTLQRLPNNLFNKIFPLVLAKSNNLFWITQRPRKADINWRELTHIHIKCNKTKYGDKVMINNYVYFGNDDYDAFDMELAGQKPKLHRFLANPYFNKYDSYEILGTQGEYL